MRNTDLWNRLQHFSVDDDASPLSFIKRLARDNNWSRDFAEAAYREYLRFVYLMSVTDVPLTPSDEVDQVWHLHLAYTRSYWQDLCTETLGHPLHHGPTKGGSSETTKFKDWYQRTLDVYREEFGEAPPADVWPARDARFANVEAFMRIDASRHFLLRKRDVYGALTALGLLLVGANAAADFGWVAGILAGLLLFIGLPVVLFIMFWIADRGRKGGRGGGGGPGGGCGGCAGCSGCGGCGG